MSHEAYEIIALQAVRHILADDQLRDRFVALTGLDASTLREGLEEKPILASVLDFLVSHEPDLIAAARAQDIAPETLVKAWRGLGGGEGQEW